ncbi:hypothetical protein A4X06_0g9931, partial [Tilletia controversa]
FGSSLFITPSNISSDRLGPRRFQHSLCLAPRTPSRPQVSNTPWAAAHTSVTTTKSFEKGCVGFNNLQHTARSKSEKGHPRLGAEREADELDIGPGRRALRGAGGWRTWARLLCT